MNKVDLIGRTTKDIVCQYTSSSQLAVTRFTLAVDRGGRDKGADFIRCVAFGKTAETMEKYVNKGDMVGISGHIQTGSYQNQQGNTVYTTDVITERMYLLPNAHKEYIENDIPEQFEQIDEESPF